MNMKNSAILIAYVASLMLFFILPVLGQNTNVAQQQFQVNCQVSFGLLDWSHTTVLNYVEPTTSMATVADNISQSIAATSTLTFNFASTFPADTDGVVVVIQDMTSPALADPLVVGLTTQTGGSSTKIPLAPNGFMCFRIQGQMPPITINNPNSSTGAVVRIGIIAQ